jgi:heme exporter protein A
MNVAALVDVPCRHLSSGQRRRAGLARVLAAGADCWLLDEPTVGLDATSVERLGALLARHRDAGGMVLAATHLPLPLPGAGELRL